MTTAEIIVLIVIALTGHAMALFWLLSEYYDAEICSVKIYALDNRKIPNQKGVEKFYTHADSRNIAYVVLMVWFFRERHCCIVYLIFGADIYLGGNMALFVTSDLSSKEVSLDT